MNDILALFESAAVVDLLAAEKNFDAASLEPVEKPLGKSRPLLLANGSVGFGAADPALSLAAVQHTQLASSPLLGTRHVEHVHLSALAAPGCTNGCDTDVGALLFSLGVEQHAHCDALFVLGAKQVEQFHFESLLNNSLSNFSGADSALGAAAFVNGVAGVSIITGSSAIGFSLTFSLTILVI